MTAASVFKDRWRVVPVAPTTGMLVAGNHCQPGDFSAALVWRSMIEAAERSTELSYRRPLPQDMPLPPTENLFELWWAEFMPEATQARAWAAYSAALPPAGAA